MSKTANRTKIIKVLKGPLTIQQIKELKTQGYIIEEETLESTTEVKPLNINKPIIPKSETIIIYAVPNKLVEVVPTKPKVPSKPNTIQQPQHYTLQQNPTAQTPPPATNLKLQQPNKSEPKTTYNSSNNENKKEQQKNQKISNGWLDNYNLERSPDGIKASCVICYYTEEQRQQLENTAQQQLDSMLNEKSFVKRESNKSRYKDIGALMKL